MFTRQLFCLYLTLKIKQNLHLKMNKNNISLFITICYLIFNTSSQSWSQTLQSYPQRISDVPLTFVAPTSVKICFPNENRFVSQPYIKMVNLYSEKKPSLWTTEAMVNEIAQQAQYLGLDAIIDLENTLSSQEIFFADISQYITVRTIKGVGIKYVSNIKNLNLLPRIQTIYQYDEDERETLLGEMNFSPYKEFIDIKGKDENAIIRIENEVKRYSLEHLLYEKGNWKYQGNILIPESRKLFRLNDWLLRECDFKYAQLGKVSKISIKSPTDLTKETISFEYGTDGRITESIIITYQLKKFKEIFSYDDLGRVKEILRYNITNGSAKKNFKPKLVLRSTFAYFNAEDFAKVIEEQTLKPK